MRRDPEALIVRKKSWGDYVLLGLRSPRIAAEARPGQFLMVRVHEETAPLLRRPFSIHNRKEGTVDIFFAAAGAGTSILAKKNPGETLDILGPLGNGFRIWKEKKFRGGSKRPGRPELARELRGQTVALVGGGRGIAPLCFLAVELRRGGARPRVFYGGRSEADLPLLEDLAAMDIDIFVSTDDGSLGFHGPVTSLLEAELRRSSPSGRPVRMFACGPDAMMENVARIAAQSGIPAQVSLESIMGCGIGACWGCVRKIKRGSNTEWVKICQDGPVFDASEVVWQDNAGEDR